MKLFYLHSLVSLITVCLLVLPVISQDNQKADSLKRLLPNLKEKDKAEVLLELANLLAREDTQASIAYSEEALDLASRHENPEEMARAAEIIGKGCFFSNDFSKAIQYMEQSLALYDEYGNRGKAAGMKQNIGLCYLKLGEFNKAKDYLQTAAAEFSAMPDMDKLPECYIDLGLVHFLMSDYATALEYYTLASEIYNKTGKTNMQSRLYNRIGMTYYSIGIYDKAVKFVMESIDLKDPADLNGRAIGYNNLGAIYSDLNEPGKAIENYLMALALHKETGDSLEMPQVLTNIGNIYFIQGKNDSALTYYLLSFRLSEDAGDELQSARTKYNIARIFMKEGKQEKAEASFRDFLELSRNTGYREGEAFALLGLGDLWLQRGEKEKARELYMECLEVSDNINLTQAQKQSHYNLSELAESTGNLQGALYHYRMYSQIKDSLFNADRARIISEMETKYETQKKQKENDLLKMENELQERKIKTLYLMTGALLVLLLAISVLIIQYRRISRNKKLLAKSEAARLAEKVEHQNRELASGALALSRNYNYITKLQSDLKEITPHVNEQGLKNLTEIIRSIQRLDNNAAWNEFEFRFRQVHSLFYEKLTASYPELTTNERRLCALLSLGMTTKEICMVTYQNIRAIEAARLRLRKKFGLKQGEDLTAFLQKFNIS
jgi:tetratricopeptide (TPR) repeat protein/DNA-binding CsgD family transcriptional regulator